MLNLIPGNHEVVAILADHVQGPYGFVHHALNPYVSVYPSAPGDSILVRASPQLQLLGQAQSRQVSAAMTLVIIFQGSGIRLVEVLSRPPAGRAVGVPRALPLDYVDVHVVPHEMDLSVVRNVVEDQLSASLGIPAAVIGFGTGLSKTIIPDAYQPFCATYDVHPELGDYLVVPWRADRSPEVTWIVTSAFVDAVHVMKPRVMTDEVAPDGI